ncbi:Gfo/Idh/MocA family oxidoreductase [bacterium]|nr:Gfo/Idh/MocA family oxidoreductase [bacterium]
MSRLRFSVVGVGGYASVHLDAVDWLHEQGLADLVGVVALKEDQVKYPDLMKSLEGKGVQIYSDLDSFFEDGSDNADVLTIPIGIHMHVPVSIMALEAGMHVYCEKPLAATVQEVDELISAQKKCERKIAVGFQHIYSHSMQQLKSRICDGRLGAVKKISVMCGWPRSTQYYTRNEWAGQMRRDKAWILDSPANNAHAHYLLNMLYLCSSQAGAAATPLQVRAELYRASHIQSPDTVLLEFMTKEGSRGNAIFSHCNARENGPVMHIRCEHGEVEWEGDIGKTMVHYKDGAQEEFDNLTHDKWRLEGFKNLVHAINENEEPICTPKMARSHTVTINAMHESCPEIATIPEDEIMEVQDWEMFPPDTKGGFRRVDKMDTYLQEAFDRKKFLSELRIPWAKHTQSRLFEIKDYDYFPQVS